MLSIQERIAGYHYAYGIWPDTYQAPHPYSIHDYFDKATMNMFERAFTKGNERPSALEWQNQLEYILKHLKQCKKDHNHSYFTPKGCGLCMVRDKFKLHVENFKKEKEKSATVRGMDRKSLETRNIIRKQHKKTQINTLMHDGYYGFLFSYLLFFTFLHKMLIPFSEQLKAMGIFVQIILLVVGVSAINKLFDYIPKYLPNQNKQNLFSMMRIYALVCLLIALSSLFLAWALARLVASCCIFIILR